MTNRPRHAFMVGLKMNLGRGGHTAGSFMGLNFEAANPQAGVRVGGGAASPWSFPWQYYLPAADRKYLGRTFDRGGWLPPGTSLATNRTGRPERVLSPREAGVKLHPDSVRALADELRANPPVVELDGQRMSPLIRKQLRSLGYRDGLKAGG